MAARKMHKARGRSRSPYQPGITPLKRLLSDCQDRFDELATETGYYESEPGPREIVTHGQSVLPTRGLLVGAIRTKRKRPYAPGITPLKRALDDCRERYDELSAAAGRYDDDPFGPREIVTHGQTVLPARGLLVGAIIGAVRRRAVQRRRLARAFNALTPTEQQTLLRLAAARRRKSLR